MYNTLYHSIVTVKDFACLIQSVNLYGAPYYTALLQPESGRFYKKETRRMNVEIAHTQFRQSVDLLIEGLIGDL